MSSTIPPPAFIGFQCCSRAVYVLTFDDTEERYFYLFLQLPRPVNHNFGSLGHPSTTIYN
jgi:hypothetical protein